MPEVDMGADVPVGTLVAFFGDALEPLAVLGWLPCDGAALDRNGYPDLFEAIGTTFGEAPDGQFMLPDLRGVFLCGADPALLGEQRDYATAQQSDGADGNSLVVSGDLSFAGYKTHGGCSDTQRIAYKGTSTGTVTITGGDAETRPVNAYCHYLIKAQPNNIRDVRVGEVPIGATMSMPVPRDDNAIHAFWRLCNGEAMVSAAGSTFFDLFNAIGTANGGKRGEGDKPERFALPDLRGLFIRGVRGTRELAKFDPDASQRETPQPAMDLPGNSGNAVGSYQDWATALPQNAFYFGLSSYPFSSVSKLQAGVATAAKFSDQTTLFKVSGGAKETRPKTLAVDWYIRFRPTAPQAPRGAYLPIGTVVASASAVVVSDWAVCNGALLEVDEFPDLALVLGTTFGGEPGLTFGLPNLCDHFLRGAAPSSITYPRPRGTPPEFAGQVQSWATGLPRSDFVAPVVGYPQDTKDIINYGTGNDNCLRISGAGTANLSGGDEITRPISVAVQFLIKLRN